MSGRRRATHRDKPGLAEVEPDVKPATQVPANSEHDERGPQRLPRCLL